jgi:SSS family solute:Na+ symporter
MLLGSTLVTLLGLSQVGGMDVLMKSAAPKMHVMLPANHQEYPFWATVLGGYFMVSVYYWCHNQTIVQRVLGARTEWDARTGTVATCFIKLILPLIYVLPGIIAFVLFPDLDLPDKAFPMLVNEVVPRGVSGLVVAAVIAALMSTASSVLNSWGTLFTYDVYHRLIEKRATSRRLILVGRLATIFLMLVGSICTPMLRGNESILQFFLNGLAYITAPVIVLYSLGIFWAGATPAAAVSTILVSPLICYLSQHMRLVFGFGPHQTSIAYWLPVAVGILTAVMAFVSSFTQPKPVEQLEGILWTSKDTLVFSADLFKRLDSEDPSHLMTASNKPGWIRDFRLLGLLALALMVVLIWYFR